MNIGSKIKSKIRSLKNSLDNFVNTLKGDNNKESKKNKVN
jgi:hypothetical protein